MKYVAYSAAALVSIIFLLPAPVAAQDASSTPPSTPPEATSTAPTIVEVSVDVPATCTVTDTDGVTHTYPQADALSAYLAICALESAIESGSISGADFSNAFPAFGLFVTSVAGVAADPSNEYWALYQNGSFASCGLGCLPVIEGDTIALQRHDFSDTDLGDHITLVINSLIATTSDPSATSTPTAEATTTPPTESAPIVASGGGSSAPQSFSVPAALTYLSSAAQSDGSYGEAYLSDWVALAFAASDPGAANARLRSYLASARPTLASVTDYERHALALEALGINPYSGTSIDTIAPIVNSFDGTQVGDASIYNDDIFALIALMHAGYDERDAIINKSTEFILSKQAGDGSWISVDITAAAIQALEPLASLPGVSAAVNRAKQYLHAQQQADGGFGDTFATAWALQAIAALGDSLSSWAPAGQSPLDYLAAKQASDGGVEPLTSSAALRIWATAYAVPAALARAWGDILTSFARPVGPAPVPAQDSVATTTPPTTATSSPALTPTATSSTSLGLVLGTSTAVKKIAIKPQAHKPTPTTSAVQGQPAAAPAAGQGTGFWSYVGGLISWLMHLIF